MRTRSRQSSADLGRPGRSFIDRAGELRRQGRSLPQIARKLGAGWEPYPSCEFTRRLLTCSDRRMSSGVGGGSWRLTLFFRYSPLYRGQPSSSSWFSLCLLLFASDIGKLYAIRRHSPCSF
jgi:hypothetical protein